MGAKQTGRYDTSLGSWVDLSPEVIAERVKRLGIVRRTAKAALRQRQLFSQTNGRNKS